MTEAVETVDYSELPPAERPTECFRDSLLKPPDWRYRQACLYLADEREGTVPMLSDDPVVMYAVRALRAMRNRRCKRFMVCLWPVMEEVLYYGTQGRNSATTAEMETCMIHGMRHQAARLAGCPVSPEVYDLYGLLFFDLTGITAVHSWVQDWLFSPLATREGRTPERLRARLLAYYGSAEAGRKAGILGMRPDRATKDLMSAIMGDERQRRLFDYVLDRTGLDPEVYAQIMEGALKSMSEHDFQEHMKDRDEAGSGSLEELAQHMEEGIRAFSQSEIESYDRDGLDFVNQYTRTLTERNSDGKDDKSR